MTHPSPHRVLVAGGGVAGLEALLALRELAGLRAELHLLSASREFLYRPVTVAEPFDRGEARGYDVAEIARDAGASVSFGELAAVDMDAREAITGDGGRHAFDTLLVATGSRFVDPLPGALVFRGRDDVERLRGLMAEIVAGEVRSLAFALSAERTWPLPLYELALMTAGYAREHGAHGLRVTLVTPEEEPLALFGPEAARALAPMLRSRGITLRTMSLPAYVERSTLVLAGGGRIHTDRVVTLPVAEGPFLPGLPHDDAGFIPVDRFGAVIGLDGVYAAGDVTNFPLKQGGLAAQQADAAAEQIAATLGAPVRAMPFNPVLRGLLLTGGAPLYLRCEPQKLARTATVAIDAVPLRPQTGISAASGQALWWPPAKIAGRYLAPHLATAAPSLQRAGALADRVPVPGPAVGAEEERDAFELALMLAECDARWGDYGAALSALAAAESLQGSLPPEYEEKRRQWLSARRFSTRTRS